MPLFSEVSIQPRSAFKHQIYAEAGKEITWAFTTKSKNISFGLYRRKESPSSPIKISPILKTPTLPMTPLGGSMSSINSLDESQLNLSTMNLNDSQRRAKKTNDVLKDAEYTEIFPVKHFDSAKITIHGNYLVEETGTYVLLFDNTFSVNTSKKLMFSVSIKNSASSPKKVQTFEGFVWKKGNKKIDESGNLQYLKNQTASSVRSSVVLSQAAVRVNHDNGQNLLHFKTLDKSDFEKIISVIEGITGNSADLEANPPPSRSASPSLEDQKLFLQQINILQTEINHLSEIGENVKSRLKSSKEVTALIESANAVQAAATSIKQTVSKLNTTYEMILDHVQQTDAILTAAINDNNKIRRNYGLEQVTRDFFINRRSRRESFYSVYAASEIFYDADDFQDANDEEFVLDDASDEEELLKETVEKSGIISRRKCLPHPTISRENISIMSILRNNVGKDLSTVAMPLALNEPLNLLQRLCEELEYSELLVKANQSSDPVERLLLVSAFAVSGYASTLNRSGFACITLGRKPFNPLLGETFEYLRPDLGIKFISEKVSHQPPVMACHASSPHYAFFQESTVKTKFWGKSMELVPAGTVHVILLATGEHFTWTKVTTCMRNIFSSTRYLEHYGTMNIKNNTRLTSVSLQFKESGYFTSAKNEVSGSLLDEAGEKVCNVTGRWDESLNMFYDSKPDLLQVLWKARPAPQNQAEMYGFSEFAVELNEITPDIEHIIPCTDTRLRPDQRMLENGLVEEAEREKLRLEQKQRDKRKDGVKWKPRWFHVVESPYEEGGLETSWQVIKDDYWEARSSKNWGELPDLFSS